jgi:1,4-dihydroxy-2-naphthoate octaprenyltransferase
VNLTGRRDRVATLANLALLLGLAVMAVVAARSSPAVLALVAACCGLGYAYQGPPLRLGYHGLGEPLCWLAFGPCATAATLIALAPLPLAESGAGSLRAALPAALAAIPWADALVIGAGPALATTLVLFCSHFHQVGEDAVHGKRSPVVRLGTDRAAALVPWFVAGTLGLEWAPVLLGWWPITALLGVIGLPAARSLIRLLANHHHEPERIRECKFLALRFQTLNGLGLACGLAITPWLS